MAAPHRVAAKTRTALESLVEGQNALTLEVMAMRADIAALLEAQQPQESGKAAKKPAKKSE